MKATLDRRFVVPLLLNLAGCGGGISPINTSDGSATVTNDAAVPVVQDMTQPPDLTGYSQQSVSIGPITLKTGEERTVCTVVQLNNTTDIDVIKIDSKLLPGSHHLIFYKSDPTKVALHSDPQDCVALGDVFSGLGASSSPPNVPLYISQTENNNALPLPAGVAYHFGPMQQVKIEAHYINATQETLQGQGTVTLTVGPSAQKYVPADIMFCGSVKDLYQGFPGGGTGVVPGVSSLTPGFYKPPTGVKIFGLTGHEHQRGTLVEIKKGTSATDPNATELVHGQPWDNEPFITYDDQHLLSFGPNEGIQWQCSYDNPDSTTYYFGESAATNEMCFFWAFYYPSVGHFISFPDCIN